jgi:hypothetical protein
MPEKSGMAALCTPRLAEAVGAICPRAGAAAAINAVNKGTYRFPFMLDSLPGSDASRF